MLCESNAFFVCLVMAVIFYLFELFFEARGLIQTNFHNNSDIFFRIGVGSKKWFN